jgi:hypothetical protein
MAFLPGATQALQLLNTLAAQPHCAARLASPQKFDTVLALVRIQAEHRDYVSARHALRVVDAILVHARAASEVGGASSPAAAATAGGGGRGGGGGGGGAAPGLRSARSAPTVGSGDGAVVSQAQAMRVLALTQKLRSLGDGEADEALQASLEHTAEQARELDPAAFAAMQKYAPPPPNHLARAVSEGWRRLSGGESRLQ